MKTKEIRILAIIIFLATLAVAFFVYSTEKNTASGWRFKLGLDLKGGTQLIYKADTSLLKNSDIKESMGALRDVIEKRVNLFGVSEPVVQVEESSVVGGAFEERLIVELPGVADVHQAINMIGKTPLLEFKVLKNDISSASSTIKTATKVSTSTTSTTATTTAITAEDSFKDLFISSGLTGRFLEKTQLEFNSNNEPIISLTFNSEGRELFAKITKENIGKQVAIFLDGEIISSPRVMEEIKEGKAQITGEFTPIVAKELVRNLNYGSLPIPIELISTQTIGASLGDRVLYAGIKAGLIGFIFVGIFIVFWYRMFGVIAFLSLITYVILVLAIYKLIPVTLTAAGIAGFILSIGIAIDANILIFERIKEEKKAGKILSDGIKEGFSRAWSPIRDGNLSGLISAFILFWLGTSLVRGFALTLGIGIITSMLTAVVISRTYLMALGIKNETPFIKFLFGSGFNLKVNKTDKIN